MCVYSAQKYKEIQQPSSKKRGKKHYMLHHIGARVLKESRLTWMGSCHVTESWQGANE